MQADLKRLFRQSGIYLFGNLFNRLGAFLLLPLYTTQLSVAEYGRLELLYSLTTVFAVVFAAGLSHSTLRFYFEQPEGPDRRRIVTTGLAMVFTLSSLGAASVYLARAPIATMLLDNAAYAPALDLCLMILVLELTTEVGFAYLRARELALFYVLVSFTKLLVQVGMSIYFVGVLHRGIFGVLQANLLTVAFGAIVVVGYTLRHCGFALNMAMLGPMLRYSIPMALGGILAPLSGNIDRFLLKEMVSLEAIGLYGLAMKFALLLTFVVLEPFHRGYGPFRFSVMGKDDAFAIQVQAAHYLFVFAMVAGLGIALVTPEILSVMAQQSYVPAYTIVPILLLGVAVGGITYCYETGILYRKKTKYLLYINIGILVAKTSLNVALIPIMGVHGAAAAFVGTNLIYAILVNRVSQKLYYVPFRYAPLAWIAALAAVFYLGSLWLDYRVLSVSIPVKLILVLVLIAVLYRFDALTRTLLRALWRAGGLIQPWAARQERNRRDRKPDPRD